MSKEEKSEKTRIEDAKRLLASRKPCIIIRSIIELGGFNDDEVNDEPSMADPSQDEPIDVLVARLLRGEYFGSNGAAYDVEPGTEAEKAFSAQSATERDGFDLSDAPALMAAADAAVKSLKPAAGTSPAAPAAVPAAPAPAPSPSSDMTGK